MASPIKKGRFGGEDLKQFKKLQERLGYETLFGADSKTLQEAVRLANKYLDVQERLKKSLKDLFGDMV